MRTYDHVPKWLGEDDHAAQLLRDGWDLAVVMDIVERAAIYHYDGQLADLHSELQATIVHVHQAPATAITSK